MQTTISAAPGSTSICSNRSMRRRLRVVVAILAALAVVGLGWGLVVASAFA